jgi:mono/diheme cytochrome c family protein
MTLVAIVSLLLLAAPAGAADVKKVDFAKDVAPIFKAYCVKCHGLNPDKPKNKPAAGLRLDDKAAALKGGKAGAVIVPGNSKDSLLFKLLGGPVTVVDENGADKELSPMPKVKKSVKWKPLSSDQVALIRQWLDQGAVWPDPK